MYNDINPYVRSIFEGLTTENTDEVVKKIEDIIAEYSLSKTNKEGFEKLRKLLERDVREYARLEAVSKQAGIEADAVY